MTLHLPQYVPLLGNAWRPYTDLSPVAWYEARSGGLSADLSGNGNTLTGVAPTIAPAASPNGGPTAQFNGTTQYLQGVFTLNQPYWIVFVGRVSQSDSSGPCIDGAAGGNSGAIGSIISGFSNPDQTINVNAGSSNGYPVIAALDTSAWRRVEVDFDGAGSDGLIAPPMASPLAIGNVGAGPAGGLTIGRSGSLGAFGDPELSAVGIFASPPTGAGLAKLRNYLDAL